jgi:hypothetical protein
MDCFSFIISKLHPEEVFFKNCGYPQLRRPTCTKNIISLYYVTITYIEEKKGGSLAGSPDSFNSTPNLTYAALNPTEEMRFSP